jgi:hypothetical protein
MFQMEGDGPSPSSPQSPQLSRKMIIFNSRFRLNIINLTLDYQENTLVTDTA